MGDIVWGTDFTARKNAERAGADRASHEVCQIAFEGGPTMEIPMSEVDAYFTDYERYLQAKFEPNSVEPPADCPA